MVQQQEVGRYWLQMIIGKEIDMVVIGVKGTNESVIEVSLIISVILIRTILME